MILFTFRPRTVAATTVLAAGVLSAPLVTPCSAQDRDDGLRITRAPGGLTIMRGLAADRAVMGVTLAEGSRADTAGVRLESVDADSPAAKAGLKAGDVITEINGVSLKVAPQDAEDLALAGLAQRRLQRVLGKATPGDEVRLQVRSGSAARAVTVKTVSAKDLERQASVAEERIVTRTPDGTVRERRSGGLARGAVGISIGSAGNARDTLGLFVNSVVAAGPAEKAGIVEGERIAAVNGVDVRVPREDVEDGRSASARVDRFVREVQKTEPGKTLTMRVWGNGRYRDVTVTAQSAADLPGGALMGAPLLMGGRGMLLPEGEVRIRREGAEPQVFEFRREGPARGRVRINGEEIEFDGAGIERAIEEMGRRLQERLRDVEIDVRDLRGLPERSGAVRLAPRGRLTRTVVL